MRQEVVIMNHSLQIPDSVLKQLIEAAEAAGTSPVEWIQARLPKTYPEPNQVTPEELAAADARLDACIDRVSPATGIDNDQIDADLAREYADNHDSVVTDSKSQ